MHFGSRLALPTMYFVCLFAHILNAIVLNSIVFFEETLFLLLMLR